MIQEVELRTQTVFRNTKTSTAMTRSKRRRSKKLELAGTLTNVEDQSMLTKVEDEGGCNGSSYWPVVICLYRAIKPIGISVPSLKGSSNAIEGAITCKVGAFKGGKAA